MKKLALCIGNNDYTILPKLSCCISDAESVEKQLKELGFDTILKVNLTREELADQIFDFIEKIESYDAILLYYAGHGFQVDGDNIIAPIDLNTNNRTAAVKMNAFPLSELMNKLNQYPNQTKIIILDACRETLGYRGTFQDFAPISAPQGSIIAFATSPGQSSKENGLTGHGRYTEALLRYIALPRVPAETVFKKTREALLAETGGSQIPWEHTSLIGDFYFNPNTIYDGVTYSIEAKSDSKFRFLMDSPVKTIVEGLKTYNWPQQESAINKVATLDFDKLSNNELFVLGRNIYQSACGNSFACQRFIDNFGSNRKIPNDAKLHLLNGMAYEIYYDSRNTLRNKYKTSYLPSMIKYLEQPEFYASRSFIYSHLCKVEDRPIYIPGQNELMYFVIKTEKVDEGYRVNDILYQGKSVFYNRDVLNQIDNDSYLYSFRCYKFEQMLVACIAAPIDCVRFEYDSTYIDHETMFFLPYYEFCIRYDPIETNEDMKTHSVNNIFIQ